MGGYETTMVDSHGFKRVEKHNTRGKVLGGSSALNYFSWMRGSKGIYDGMTDVITGEYPEQLPRHSDDLMHRKLLERVSTGYHPCGSCRMGRTIEEGVVNGRLKVFGVQGLRVVDASVMPVIPDGRIQSPVYMIAEKAAHFVGREYSASQQQEDQLPTA